MYNGLSTSFESYPADDKVDANAYKAAIDALEPGSAITIFTPDTTHYEIALYAIRRKIHVLTLSQLQRPWMTISSFWRSLESITFSYLSSTINVLTQHTLMLATRLEN